MKLREIMTAPVLTVRPDEPASDALARMRDERVRHAVVVSNRVLTGVVSERDLGGPRGGVVRRGRTVGDLMQPEPIVGSPDQSVSHAVGLVRENRIGCLPIVEGGELIGIVTRGDLLAALARRRKRDRSRAAHDATELPRPPWVASPNRDKWP